MQVFRLSPSRVWKAVLIVCLVSFAGCVTKSAGANGTSYHYNRWIAVGVFFLGQVVGTR